jgi:hypothetical protein
VAGLAGLGSHGQPSDPGEERGARLRRDKVLLTGPAIPWPVRESVTQAPFGKVRPVQAQQLGDPARLGLSEPMMTGHLPGAKRVAILSAGIPAQSGNSTLARSDPGLYRFKTNRVVSDLAP